MALMSYLLKDRNGTYYFRRVIPAALRPFMPPPWTGKANWKRSLRTKKPADAKVAAARALSDCTESLQAAKRAQHGDPAVHREERPVASIPSAEIEADILRELLADDERERRDGDARRQLQTPELRQQWPDLVPVDFNARGMMFDHHYVYGDEIDERHTEYRQALSRSDPSIVNAQTRIYLRRHSASIDPTSDAFYEAGLAVLRGHVRAYGLMRDRHRGEIVETPLRSATKGPKLSQAFERWKLGGSAKGSKRPGGRTVTEAEHAIRRFAEWHGDISLGDITRAKARDFRDTIARVPTRLPRKLVALPLRTLFKHDLSQYPSVHAATVNKSLQLLSAIIAHAIREGAMDGMPDFANPFDKGVKLDIDSREAEGRLIFEPADLKAIFGTGVYTDAQRPAGGGGEAAFWLPLIALFTGARQGEIAELRIMDLKRDPDCGLWFLDISTEGGRSIKTASSRRKVPLHPELERIGLLRYRQSLIDTGASLEADLWPDIVSDALGRRAGPWSKWFNRHLRQVAKVGERGKVFHSFRHSFKRMARDAALSEEMHDALTGHSGGGVGRSYGGGFGLKALSEAISHIETPEPMRHLVWKPGEASAPRPRKAQQIVKRKLVPRVRVEPRPRRRKENG